MFTFVSIKRVRPRLISSGVHGRLGYTPDLYGEWVKANKLFAKLTSANIFNFSGHAVHSLDSLLDSPLKERKLFVSAAAQHVIFSSVQLFTFCTKSKQLTQWNKWRQAFSSAAQDCTLEESDRRLAHKAAPDHGTSAK